MDPTPKDQENSDKNISQNTRIKDYRLAKRILKKIHAKNQREIYCGCAYEYTKGNNSIPIPVLDLSCGLAIRSNKQRGYRMEWEHVVPAHRFGRELSCWKEKLCSKNGKKFGGRNCCNILSSEFARREADLHNIQPSAGELNADRANFSFGEIPGEERKYGTCDFEVDFKKKLAEPREEIRGDLARSYLYMNEAYSLGLSQKEIQLFNEWNRLDPPDEWEIERNRLIQKYQGNANPFIENYELLQSRSN